MWAAATQGSDTGGFPQTVIAIGSKIGCIQFRWVGARKYACFFIVIFAMHSLFYAIRSDGPIDAIL